MAARTKSGKRKAAKKKRGVNSATLGPQKATPDPDLVRCMNQTDAAAWVGVSVTMFRQYQVEPHARRGREVYYSEGSLKELIRKQAYDRGYKAGVSATPVDAADLLTAQARAELRLTEERGETQSLKNAQLRRELIPVQVISMVLAKIGSQISGALDPLPGALKRRVAKLTTADIHTVKEVIAKCKNTAAAATVDWDEFDIEFDAKTGDSGD